MQEQQKDQNFKIPAALLTATLNYLADRPYKEVAHLVGLLAGLELVEKKEEDSKE